MNTNELDDLRRDLRLLADSPHPFLFADPNKARARARRTAVWRRSAVGVSVVASVSVLAAAVAPGGGSIRSVPAAPGAASSTIPLNATFGFLPPGFRIVSYSGWGGNSRVDAQRKGTQAVLSLIIDKGDRRTLGKGSSGPAPAPKVAGRPAVWKADPSLNGGLELDFQAGPDSIGALALQNPPEGFDALGELTKVAYAVRLGPQPMTFPFQFHGLPGYITRMSVGDAQVSPETWGGTGGSTMYSLQEPNIDSITEPSKVEGFSVNEQPISHNSIFNCAPNTTVAGHPAYYGNGDCFRSPKPPPGVRRTGKSAPRKRLCVMGMSNGLQLCLTAIGVKTLASLKPGGGLIGLFERSTFYGSDQSTWTTRPLG